MDSNDDVTCLNPKRGIGRLISETDLINLHHFKHPSVLRPSTYSHRRLTLDFCLGSPEFAHALTGAAILPFGIPIHLTGNHQALILNFDSRILFGNAPPTMYLPSKRGVSSNAIPTVTKFCKLVGEASDAAHINEQITAIEKLTELNNHARDLLNHIDNDLTRILVTADKCCRKLNSCPWSINLHKAFLDHKYWTIRLRELRTKRSYAHALQLIIDRLGTDFVPLQTPDTVSTRLRRAQREICTIQCNAQAKRQQYLDDLLRKARAAKDNNRKSLILGLKHAEETRQCFALVRAALNLSTPGGLTHLLIPDKNDHLQWVCVSKVADIDDLLLEHS